MATVSFDKLVSKLHKLGIPAYVEQTGGGCATVYVGTPFEDESGDLRYPVLVGPGWFASPGWRNGFGDTAELAVGPDDDGESDPWCSTPEHTDEDVLNAVLAFLNEE